MFFRFDPIDDCFEIRLVLPVVLNDEESRLSRPLRGKEESFDFFFIFLVLMQRPKLSKIDKRNFLSNI